MRGSIIPHSPPLFSSLPPSASASVDHSTLPLAHFPSPHIRAERSEGRNDITRPIIIGGEENSPRLVSECVYLGLGQHENEIAQGDRKSIIQVGNKSEGQHKEERVWICIESMLGPPVPSTRPLSLLISLFLPLPLPSPSSLAFRRIIMSARSRVEWNGVELGSREMLSALCD